MSSRKWTPLLAISLGSFMLLVDVTIVNVALPAMARDLSTSFTSLQWVIDAYALVLAALLLGFGSAADGWGHRRLYVGGLLVFGLGSLTCGLATTPGVLVASRAVQGIGGAAMFATTFALLNASYAGRDRATAYGVWSAVSGAAAALGPVLGGVLTQAVSWRWIFFVNVPVAVATVALTLAVVPRPGAVTGKRVDVPGTVAFSVAAATVTFALTRSADAGWGSATVVGSLVVGAVALAAFLLLEVRSRAPMLELGLFRRGSFSAAVLAALVLSFSAFAVLTYTTIWMQTVLGLSAVQAGLVSLPLPALSAVLSASFGRLLSRFPVWLTMGGGLVLIGVGALLSAVLLGATAGWPALLPGLALTGTGLGVCVPTLSSTASSAVGDERAGVASGAVNTARQLGQAMGIALLGSLAAAAAASSLTSDRVGDPTGVASALVGGGAQSILSDARPGAGAALDAAFASGLELDFVVAGVLAVVSGLLVALLVRRAAGAEDDGPARGPQAGTHTLHPGEHAART